MCIRRPYTCAVWIAQFEGQMKGANRFHAFQWCICGCTWLSMVQYTNYPHFLCHSVLQWHLFSRSLAADSLACSIHYFSFVSNAAVLWVLALLCFIQDLVTCVDFSRPCTVFLLFCLQIATWVFRALAVEAVFSLTSTKSPWRRSWFRCPCIWVLCVCGFTYRGLFSF